MGRGWRAPAHIFRQVVTLIEDDVLQEGLERIQAQHRHRVGVRGLRQKTQKMAAIDLPDLDRDVANRDRLSRLVATVAKRFPDSGLDEATVDHLMLAQKLRGVVAHGLFEPEAGSSRALQRAFTATEALSYLLMIKDLPLTQKGCGRATSSRLVRDYRYAKVAPDI